MGFKDLDVDIFGEARGGVHYPACCLDSDGNEDRFHNLEGSHVLLPPAVSLPAILTSITIGNLTCSWG